MNLLLEDPKYAFTCGAEARLRRRSRLFDNFEARQQGFEIDALKLFTAVKYKRLWQPPIAAHALAQDHHARAIAGGSNVKLGWSPELRQTVKTLLTVR
ncbi:MAG: hypothetical protein WB676_27075 [Bryobacteraceae bacterium]